MGWGDIISNSKLIFPSFFLLILVSVATAMRVPYVCVNCVFDSQRALFLTSATTNSPSGWANGSGGWDGMRRTCTACTRSPRPSTPSRCARRDLTVQSEEAVMDLRRYSEEREGGRGAVISLAGGGVHIVWPLGQSGTEPVYGDPTGRRGEE